MPGSGSGTYVLYVYAACLAAHGAFASTAIGRAYVDATGRAHVVYEDGRDTRVPAEKDQVSCDKPAIAPDRRTAGWLVNVPNCCTSYPVPITLVIYRSGRVIARIGDGMMLYGWKFVDGGRKVAVSSGTVHGMTFVHFTLYEASTGKLLATWDGHEDDTPPDWGTGINH